MQQTIHERTFRFSLRILRLYRALLESQSAVNRIVGNQIFRSATSVGAMVEEAGGAESLADFIHKLSIAQKELRESRYWLRLISEGGLLESARLTDILAECQEINAILTATIVKMKKKQRLQREKKHSPSNETRGNNS
jgi:four helix bundle protein